MAMDNFLQDLKFAVRSLRRRPGFSTVAILTLALGIGATTAIFSVVYGVVLRPLPYPDADRIVSIGRTDLAEPGQDAFEVSPVDLEDWDEPSRSLDAMAEYTTSRATLTGGDNAEVVPAAVVTPNFFRVFEAAPAMGRTFTPEETLPNGPDVVVVSHGYWQERLGGRADVLGSTVELGGRSYQIVGVAPEGFDFPQHARLWRPLQNDASRCGRACIFMDAAARLAPGATVADAQRELSAIAARVEEAYPGTNKHVGVKVQRLQDRIVGSADQALDVLFAAVALVLLIACANVSNLMLVRGAARREEVAVRASLGAGRQRLVTQLLTEAVVLAMVGGLFGVALSWAGVEALRALSPGDIPRLDEVGVDGATLLFGTGLVAATSLLFGLAPALGLARTPIASVLRQGGRGGAGDRSLGRAGLVVAEVGFSLVLLVGAGLLLRSFARLASVNPGFQTERVVKFRVNLPSDYGEDPDRTTQFWTDLERELAAAAGTREVGTAAGLPLSQMVFFTSMLRTDRPPPPPGEEPGSLIDWVTPGFLDVLGVPVVRGRKIEDGDRWGTVPVAVVSRAAAAKFWPGEDPVGKQIRVGITMGYPDTTARTIVGVVGDLRYSGLKRDPDPIIYAPIAQTAPSFGSVVVRTTGSPASTLRAAREIVHRLEPGAPVMDPGIMDDLVSAELARPRFMLLLVGLFAGLAVVLAAIGIYGVVAYVVARRTREIGVRIALGATRGRVLGLVLRQGLQPAAVGVALGILVSAFAVDLLRAQLYSVEPKDPLTMAGAGVVLLAVTALACLVPAHRAAGIPPATALRIE